MRIESDVPCEVLTGAGDRWRAVLELITDSIVFIDEENQFIRQKEFAETVRFVEEIQFFETHVFP